MKKLLRSLFSPILSLFEYSGDEYTYQKSHRKILIIVGLLFLVLSAVSLYASIVASEWGGAIPFVGFLLAGLVCEVVGLLGTDRAVANMWKAK